MNAAAMAASPRLKVVADPFESGVVVEQGAKQRLLGFNIGRSTGDDDIVRDGAQIKRGNQCHTPIDRPSPPRWSVPHRILSTRSGEAVDEAGDGCIAHEKGRAGNSDPPHSKPNRAAGSAYH